MTLKEHLEKENNDDTLIFYPVIEREMLFNLKAYKLKLSVPLDKFKWGALPHEMLSNPGEKKIHDFDKELIDIDTIYILSKTDFDIFDKEKYEEEEKWIYKKGSLFLTITNPIFHKGVIIQDPKCWLISNESHFMNYINYVDSNLALEYFKNK